MVHKLLYILTICMNGGPDISIEMGERRSNFFATNFFLFILFRDLFCDLSLFDVHIKWFCIECMIPGKNIVACFRFLSEFAWIIFKQFHTYCSHIVYGNGLLAKLTESVFVALASVCWVEEKRPRNLDKKSSSFICYLSTKLCCDCYSQQIGYF